MKSKYKIVVIITLLLISLSLIISFLNYIKSLEQTKRQLVEVSLPLSINNIYTEVQKNVIEPLLISSMMANDTFLKDWILHEEENTEKIKKYLTSVKNKFGLLNTFLVSDKSKNYYTMDGVLYQVNENDSKDSWYFKFKHNPKKNELNLDFNSYIDDSVIMFINYKIFDIDFNYLGATGVAVKIAYIEEMLKRFRTKFKFNVFFVNKDGEVVLSERKFNKLTNIKDDINLKEISSKIFDGNEKIEYEKYGEKYILNSEYIKELDLYLIVEAKINNFLNDVRETFYINLFFSIFVTLLVIYIILLTTKKYNKNLENLANIDTLTKLPNRRSFMENFEKTINLFKRNHNNYCLIYFDIDDFKKINDTLGHLVGDKVLIRIGEILNLSVRKSDYVSRWGGEEFTILCNEIDIQNAKLIAQKIKVAIEFDDKLKNYVHGCVTASFGVTQFRVDDSYDTIITRADNALYEAKENGKNNIIIA